MFIPVSVTLTHVQGDKKVSEWRQSCFPFWMWVDQAFDLKNVFLGVWVKVFYNCSQEIIETETKTCTKNTFSCSGVYFVLDRSFCEKVNWHDYAEGMHHWSAHMSTLGLNIYLKFYSNTSTTEVCCSHCQHELNVDFMIHLHLHWREHVVVRNYITSFATCSIIYLPVHCHKQVEMEYNYHVIHNHIVWLFELRQKIVHCTCSVSNCWVILFLI